MVRSFLSARWHAPHKCQPTKKRLEPKDGEGGGGWRKEIKNKKAVPEKPLCVILGALREDTEARKQFPFAF